MKIKTYIAITIVLLSAFTVISSVRAGMKMQDFQLTQTQISSIKNARSFTPVEVYIYTEVMNNRIPTFDITKSDPIQVARAYITVAEKLGDKMDDFDENNLFKRIRNQANKIK